MTTTTFSRSADEPGFLSREATIAKPGFNRWLVPPAALAIHLCIGMAYGFSVFWIPLSRAIGITKSIDCPVDAGLINALFTTTCDWKQSELGWMYTLFFVLLGSSAAIFDHPVRSLVALVNQLARLGDGLKAGEIVLAGGATAAIALAPGDVVELRVDQLGRVDFSVDAD